MMKRMDGWMDGWMKKKLTLIYYYFRSPNMKFLAAYLLLNAGGKTSPSADDIKNLLNTVGIENDEERITSLIAALSEKDVAQLIEEGKEKLASVPTGGAGAVASSGAAGAGASAEAAEEVKEEEKEESDDDMGFGLFD
ncbi:ribosomal protein, large P2 [Halteromyces radiatus]|uniref:ribosomal protein, large P2 n=1 Tax=Halteromyces radiatus TaxID=101107 RepID=UPI002221136D|nr:ribosomal protein, large P2 [Halteromyces radiatus]KAI8098457.1 ribosomal protein, large P2 [Halteromyces radiatus]